MMRTLQRGVQTPQHPQGMCGKALNEFQHLAWPEKLKHKTRRFFAVHLWHSMVEKDVEVEQDGYQREHLIPSDCARSWSRFSHFTLIVDSESKKV